MKPKRILFCIAALGAGFTSPLLVAEPKPSTPPPSTEPVGGSAKLEAALEKLKMPGVKVNVKERCVDVDAEICLDAGALELVACTKETKEHESIVAIDARPMHVHTALLLMGAKAGNPAMRKPIDDDSGRWIDLPPRGGPVDVFLVFKNKKGELVERPINDFIIRNDDDLYGFAGEEEEEDAEPEKFPTNTFLFAGSHLIDDGSGKRRYICDSSGNVISLATFGDEVLCLPDIHGHANGELLWQVDSTELPAVGSKVTLRLRPQQKAAKP